MAALALGALAACGVDHASRSNELPTPSTAPSTGSLEITIGGLNGADGDVLITGPGGFSRTLSASEKLTGLAATTYTVVASPVQSALYDFVPGPAEFLITISAGVTSNATVSYVATTGALTINVSGLPVDRTASISLTGSGTTTLLTSNGTTGRLRPGVYVVSAQGVPDVSLRYTAANSAATVTAGLTRSVAVSYGLSAAARSSTDRPDDATGAQLKVLYAVPIDGTDRGLDTAGVLQRSISSWQRWLASQTGGRHLRLETVGGSLDVQFVRLPRADAVYRSFGAAIRDTLEKDLLALGVVAALQPKIYLTYYEGGHIDRCGSAAFPPLLPGRIAVLYLKGTITGRPDCDTNPFAVTSTSAPGYLEFVAVHEVLHVLGLVSVAAPDHGFNGHLTTDSSDLMYAGSARWTPSRIDQAQRNYFNTTGLPGSLGNLATSPFVITP